MAGAMRRMGIYLGLVEDDDTRGYGRYDARQGEYAEHPEDRRFGRYAPEESYDERYEEPGYPAGGYADDEPVAERPVPVRDAEPLAVRRVTPARPLGLAPSGPGGSASRSGTPAGATAAGLAVREQVPAPAPVPEPAPKQPYRITTLHPRTYNEARTIGERFRDGMPVIMNLTEMDDSDAKRLVDFAAGLSFGLRGSIERVTAKVFLLSPQDVDVTAEDKARIREGGFFNQS
jgi:cell division inhibitor SepF